MFSLVKVKILDEVNAVIIGLHPDHVMLFYDMYARFAANYFFSPKFKLGAWDGKIRYFHKTGKTYVYLLDEIIPKIISLGYKLELIDGRSVTPIKPPAITDQYFAHIIHPEDDVPIILRHYQVTAVNKLFDAGHGIAIAGTGGGKTIICGAIADSYNKVGYKVLIIVPSQDLITQTIDEFEILEIDTGEYSGDNKDYKHPTVVSTWQALKNNPAILGEFDVVIVDECHGIKGNVLTELLNDHGKKIVVRYGVTGTLPKEETDAMAVRIAVGDVQYEIPAHELISQGYLATVHIDVVKLNENFKPQYKDFLLSNPIVKLTYNQFLEQYFPDFDAEKSYLEKNKTRTEYIAKLIEQKRDLKKGNVFCLVNGINFGKKLAELIPGAIFVYGKDKKKARKEIYNLFKENDNITVIATVHIAGTGLNIKRIFNLFLVDMGKSFIRVIQTIGRGLRKAHDKDSVWVIDVTSNLKYSKKHTRERKKYYSDAKYPFDEKDIVYTKEDNI